MLSVLTKHTEEQLISGAYLTLPLIFFGHAVSSYINIISDLLQGVRKRTVPRTSGLCPTIEERWNVSKDVSIFGFQTRSEARHMPSTGRGSNL